MDTYDLLYEKYSLHMKQVIPDGMMAKNVFRAFLSEALEGMELIETDDQQGFLYYALYTEDILHCYVPVYGYFAEDEKTMVRLFQKLAENVVKDNPCEFSVHLYSSDHACIMAYHMMQFGTMAEKGILRITLPDSTPDFTGRIYSVSKEEICKEWEDIWAATAELIDHLRKSPVFYPADEFTEEVYKAFFLDDDTRLILARDDDGKIAGMIEWNLEESSLLDPAHKSVNVGEAFVYPKYRGSGLAQALLTFAKKAAADAGAAYMWVEHGTANPNARGFWNKYFTSFEYELVRRIG